MSVKYVAVVVIVTVGPHGVAVCAVTGRRQPVSNERQEVIMG